MNQPAAFLLTTKLHRPPLRPDTIPRAHLLAQLERSVRVGRKLVLVAAPAGFGKTTLLSHWCEWTSHANVWLSLDAVDNDPNRFLTYFTAALQTIHPDLGSTAQMWLASAQPPPLQTIMATLINELATLPDPLLIVLNDYHLIDAPAIHAALAFLLEHMPPQLHLIIASRTDPPMPLAQLRAQGQLYEVRAADLRFTEGEAAAFLRNDMHPVLSDAEVSALVERTEGWIAGLQLAALSLQRQEDKEGFIKAFAGSHHYILDYLMDEVLRQQPQKVQDFLLQTAVLDRLCGPLCDAVTGDEDGQDMLENLESANLFLVPLDDERCWYRYHGLFADVLRHRLRHVYPERISQLHNQASRWYTATGMLAEAIHHALSAEDWIYAGVLIAEEFFPHIMSGQQFTTKRWLEAISDEVRATQPRLCLYYAWNLLFTGEVDAYAHPLQLAEQTWQIEGNRHGLGEVYNLRANVARLRGDSQETILWARQAVAMLPQDDYFARSIATMALGSGYLMQGDTKQAEPLLSEALDLGQATENLITQLIAMVRLGDLYVMRGNLYRAATQYRQVLDLAGDRPIWQRVEAYTALADLHCEWNDLPQAEQYLDQALTLAQRTEREIYLSHAYGVLARLRHAQGRIQEAINAIEQARATAEAFGHSHTIGMVNAQRVRLWQQSRMERQGIEHWIDEHSLMEAATALYERQIEIQMLSRIYIERGETEKALAILDLLEKNAIDADRSGDLIAIHLLRALAHWAGGEAAPALDALAQSLALAKPSEYIRIFVEEGSALINPLRRLLERPAVAGYAARLLTLLGEPLEHLPVERTAPVTQPLIEPLTPRELEVLQYLAKGASNGEIAAALVISLYTVKKHVSNLLGKLNVDNRTEAAAKAHQLALL